MMASFKLFVVGGRSQVKNRQEANNSWGHEEGLDRTALTKEEPKLLVRQLISGLWMRSPMSLKSWKVKEPKLTYLVRM